MWCLSSRSNEILALRFEDLKISKIKITKVCLFLHKYEEKNIKKKFIILNYQVIKFKDKKRN